MYIFTYTMAAIFEHTLAIYLHSELYIKTTYTIIFARRDEDIQLKFFNNIRQET